ncbi:MAG: D-alanyl-D-alanine carboxypeptidase family protein [Spirochaetes bacterium]|nr:D-alanyl-D-alanine carboxypeptidase family protein [Spirochaetota bacterium]
MKKINTIILLMISITSITYSAVQTTIGFSWNNLPIKSYQFGKGKNLLLITAGQKGTDKKSITLGNELITLLSEKKITLPRNITCIVLPRLNPDGYQNQTTYNAHQVELTYNFPANSFQTQYFYYQSPIFCGPSSGSEKETASLISYVKSLKKQYQKIMIIQLNDHSFANLMIGNLAFSPDNLNLWEENGFYYQHQFFQKKHQSFYQWIDQQIQLPIIDVYIHNLPENNQQFLLSWINLLKNQTPDKNKPDINSQFIQQLIMSLPESVQENIIGHSASLSDFTELYHKMKDEELLLLVNKSHFLSADYFPVDLKNIHPQFATNKPYAQLRSILFSDLESLYKHAEADGASLKIISAFRSYETQERVYEKWKSILGKEEADRVSALPGSSQHQLGTAVDFNMLEEKFADTKEGRWLADHAYQYGFVIAYPQGLEHYTGYKFEPWHYRYIGKEAAYLVYQYFENNLELFLNWYWESKLF